MQDPKLRQFGDVGTLGKYIKNIILSYKIEKCDEKREVLKIVFVGWEIHEPIIEEDTHRTTFFKFVKRKDKLLKTIDDVLRIVFYFMYTHVEIMRF